MRLVLGPSVLVVALVTAAAFALLQRSTEATAAPTRSNPTTDRVASLDGLEDRGKGAPSDLDEGPAVLPPNHPPIAPSRGADMPDMAVRDEAPAITWTAPSGWDVAPSTSSMRLVTYHTPALAAGASQVEVTVTRAGGTPEANLDRWVGQFAGAGAGTRGTRTVDGLRVSTLEVHGTYEGGMGTADTEEPHPAWVLLGAVVETQGLSYFFKMVGPAAIVSAAHPAFDSLVGSIRKVS